MCCVGSELCDELISCSEESYCVCVCVCVCVCLIVLSKSLKRRGDLGPILAVASQKKKIQRMSQLIQTYAQFDTVSLQKPVHRYTGSESCRVLSDFSANDICHPDGGRSRAARYGCFNSRPPTQRPRLATECVASESITVVSRPLDVFVPCSYTWQNMCKPYSHCHCLMTAGCLSLSTGDSDMLSDGSRNSGSGVLWYF